MRTILWPILFLGEFDQMSLYHLFKIQAATEVCQVI